VTGDVVTMRSSTFSTHGAAAMEQDLPVLDAVVERVIHVGADGHTVVALTVEPDRAVKAAGTALAGTRPGETVRLSGRWTSSDRHGETFRVTSCEHVLPSTVHAIGAYLRSGFIKGIGPKMAHAIVSHFGADTLEVIDRSPDRLRDVIGIGSGRQALITRGWQEQRTIRETMIFLSGIGVSPRLAVRIHARLGADTLRVVQRRPYELIEKVHGIGFDTADTIARAMGLPADSPTRLQAALLHVLDEARGREGHCYLPFLTLLRRATQRLDQNTDLVQDALSELRDQDRVTIEHTADAQVVVFPIWLHRAESRLADNITRLLLAPSQLPATQTAPSTADDPGRPLSDEQASAVAMALTRTVSILTGGPGSGKSHTIAAITHAARARGATVTLAAPTGRAAKRLTELTGRRAATVHRLIHDRNRPPDDDALFHPAHTALDADLVIVDEASMLDVTTADHLLSLIPSGTHLLLVGDVDQLPSVGPGALLRDLLHVEAIPSIRLHRVFRQGPGSSIIDNAHRVIHGQNPVNSPEFWFHPVDEDTDPTDIADLVVDIATHRLPRKQGVDPSQVQVLCPARGTDLGAIALSRLLQAQRNPSHDERPEHWADERAFRVGDKVMPVRNDYTKGEHGVFNGSTATITAIDTENQSVHIRLDDGDEATYDFTELDQLAHGYAITVHRSQGSEYPYVVVPLTTATPHILLQRNLLYTAITRAQKLVVLVGHPRALAIALNQPARHRNTLLTSRLGEHPPEPVATTAIPTGQYTAF
jgi:exodeoxyribonuclease V alpha subunit